MRECKQTTRIARRLLSRPDSPLKSSLDERGAEQHRERSALQAGRVIVDELTLSGEPGS